jgi:hypothetical protein
MAHHLIGHPHRRAAQSLAGLPHRLRERNALSGRTGCWVVLTVATIALLGGVHLLPFYDYYQWLFQGHVVAGLWTGRQMGGQPLSDIYGLRLLPVPNMAAPVGIGLLNLWLPIEAAGKLFLIVGVLAFSYSYAYLARSIQQRPTVIEFTGFIWAFGFFLYKGYISYLFALALAFVIIGLLHRAVARSERGPTRATFAAVTLLGAALYLCHLLAWSVGFLATLIYALMLFRRGQRRRAGMLVATSGPALIMLAWYAAAKPSGAGVVFYGSAGEKIVSLVEPLLVFVRLNPFPAALPIGSANLVVLGAVIAVVAGSLDWPALRRRRFSRPVLWLGALLATAALLIPISSLGDLLRPDERFTLPAALIVLAALPFRDFTLRPSLAMVGVATLVLTAHFVEYRAVSGQMRSVDQAADAAVVPAGAPLLSVSLYATGTGCPTTFGPDVPALTWFGVDRAIEKGQTHANFAETSFVYSRFDQKNAPGLTMLATTLPEFVGQVLPSAPSRYAFVEVLACGRALTTVQQHLAASYEPVSAGDGFEIFRRR